MPTPTDGLSLAPLEIWERIIDSAAVHIEGYHPVDTYYSTMRVCSLVCQAWLPRARYNLYRIICLSDTASHTEPSKIYSLSQTLAEHPHLARVVIELQVRPRLKTNTIPFTVAVGPTVCMRSLTCLKSVVLENIDWRYPRLYNLAMSRFPSVSNLELKCVSFDTATNLFQLLWALPLLSSLTLRGLSIISSISEVEFARLCSLCPPSACANLQQLSISGDLADTQLFPPLGAFGNSVRELSLELSWRSWEQTRLRDCLATMQALEKVYVKVYFGGGETTSSSSFPTALLSTLPVNNIQTITMNLHPVLQENSVYGMSRIGIIEALAGDDECTLAMFANLQVFKLSLMDNVAIHDAVWWESAIKSKLPRRLTDAVYVNVRQSYVQRLWDPESSSVRSPARRALLIGIQYAAQHSSCHRDVQRLWELLTAKLKYHPEDIAVLIDHEDFGPNVMPSKANILREVRELVRGVRQGDHLVLFYSGHTTALSATAPSEEDVYNEALVPFNCRESGVNASDYVLDSDLHSMLVDTLPTGVELLTIFDSNPNESMFDRPRQECNDVSSNICSISQYRGRPKQEGIVCGRHELSPTHDDCSTPWTRGKYTSQEDSLAGVLIDVLRENPTQTPSIHELRKTLSHMMHRKKNARERLTRRHSAEALRKGIHNLDNGYSPDEFIDI